MFGGSCFSRRPSGLMQEALPWVICWVWEGYPASFSETLHNAGLAKTFHEQSTDNLASVQDPPDRPRDRAWGA